jgi:hypothetical protein
MRARVVLVEPRAPLLHWASSGERRSKTLLQPPKAQGPAPNAQAPGLTPTSLERGRAARDAAHRRGKACRAARPYRMAVEGSVESLR